MRPQAHFAKACAIYVRSCLLLLQFSLTSNKVTSPSTPHQGPAAEPAAALVRGAPVSGESSLLSGCHGNGCSFLPVSWLQGKTRTPKRRQWQLGGGEVATGPLSLKPRQLSPHMLATALIDLGQARAQLCTSVCSCVKGDNWTREDQQNLSSPKHPGSRGSLQQASHWKWPCLNFVAFSVKDIRKHGIS